MMILSAGLRSAQPRSLYGWWPTSGVSWLTPSQKKRLLQPRDALDFVYSASGPGDGGWNSRHVCDGARYRYRNGGARRERLARAAMVG
jgi:hypothetical protein